MSYTVKEIHYTLQGEGANTGYPVVLLRFAGCNLWSGRDVDRDDSACRFCDTDFVGTDGPGGGKYNSAVELGDAVDIAWQNQQTVHRPPFVVCTGGEPLLQLDSDLIADFHSRGFGVAVETNGTVAAPDGVDWLCVSPKAGTDLLLTNGDELKLVYPQEGLDPEQFENLEFDHFFLQPMDSPDLKRHTELAVGYCLSHPLWCLSLQMHKIVDIP